MSGIINSYFIEPALRQARRFSTTPDALDDHGVTSTSQATLPLRQHSLLREQAADNSVVDETNDLSVTGDELHPRLSSVDSGDHGQPLSANEPAVGYRLVPDSNAVPTALNTDSLLIQSPQALQQMPSEPSQPIEVLHANMALPQAGRANLNSQSIDSYVSRSSAVPNSRRDLPLQPRDTPSTSSSVPASFGEGHERQYSSSSGGFSGTLPANDGMKVLREKLHHIREMALSSEEKAQRIHALMNADYNEFRTRQREGPLTSSSSRRSSRGGSLKTPSRSALQLTSMDIPDAKSLELRRQYNVKAADLRPTFRPHSPVPEAMDEVDKEEDEEEEEEEEEFGCKHYMRNVKIQCSDCRNWYTCRHCHDDAEDHLLARKRIANMLCMFCGLPQPAAEFCKGCDETAALYYCDICKLWDNDPRSRIYHCDDCGICRRGEGLGKDFVHCKRCNVCISIRWAETHRCVERATDCDCPICGEYMFTSSTSVVAMKCGHYIHRNCYDAYMQTSYKCPICNRSAVNMELQWRKLDQAIETQPMPEQYQNSRALIVCNDCNIRSETSYHWLGLKCLTCDSYNTQEIRVTNLPANSEDVTRPTHPDQAPDPDLEQRSTLVQRDSMQTEQPSTTVDHEHAIQPILDLRAHSPLPDAFAASALEDPYHPGSTEPGVASDYKAPENVSPESPQIAGTTVFGSPSSTAGLMAGPSTHARSVSTPSQPPEPYFHGDNSPFWGDSISPSALLNRIGSPVLTRIGSPVWSSPRLFGSNASAQGDTTNERRRSESDDDEDYFIDEDEGGGFGWGISPSGWGISPPAFFAERFLGRGRTNQVEQEITSNKAKDDVALSDDQSDSESGSGSEADHEPEEAEVEEESEFFQLPGHR